jgi:hypothetical protein
MKKHRKKKAATLGLVGIVALILTFYGDIYPLICPLFNDRVLCEQLGKVAGKLGKELDNNDGDIELDMDAGIQIE